ncbi:MAG: tyrosine-type recombinase/integrase [Acidimicrobiia bacterium]
MVGFPGQGPPRRAPAQDEGRAPDRVRQPGALRQAPAAPADRLLDRDGYVFSAPAGGPINYATFYGLHFKPAVRAALPDHLCRLRFHDLRSTYATLLVEQGAHPKEMAELLGHSSVQITLDRYSHVMPHMAAALAERMDAVYRAAEPLDAWHSNGSVTRLQ